MGHTTHSFPINSMLFAGIALQQCVIEKDVTSNDEIRMKRS